MDALSKTPLILFIAWHCGRLFSLARLPKISGYLFAGVFAGSEGFGMLSLVATKCVLLKKWPSPLRASCSQAAADASLPHSQEAMAREQRVPGTDRHLRRQRAVGDRAPAQGTAIQS